MLRAAEKLRRNGLSWLLPSRPWEWQVGFCRISPGTDPEPVSLLVSSSSQQQ